MVSQDADFDEFLKNVDKPTLIEKFIEGRDLTVGILDGRALCVSEQLTTNGLNDYAAKFGLAPKTRITPAEVPEWLRVEVSHQAEVAHQAIGCEGLTRVDFRWNDSLGKNGIYVIELNSQPAIGTGGVLDAQLEYHGFTLGKICEHLIMSARLRF